MSSYAISTLRQRKPQRVGFFATALSTLLMLWMVISGQVALAAPVPPPANANPKSVTTTEDTAVAIDTDVDFDNVRYQIVILTPGPVHGTATEGAAASADGDFVINYTPGANQTNSVSFAYQICTKLPAADPPIVCGQSAAVTVSINPVNDGPQAGADNRSATYGQSILIDVLANDNGGTNEGDPVSLVPGSVTVPTNAVLVVDGTAVIEGNQIRYTAPTAAAAGVVCPGAAPAPVTFSYQIQDAGGQFVNGAVTVTLICPAPLIKLSAPYEQSNQTFKVDVIVESTVADVAAVDATFAYNSCLTEPDLPSDNKLADDVTTTLPAASFLFQAQDTVVPNPGPGTIRIIAASTTSPASVLAGPGATTSRTIATIQFRLKAATPPAPCTPNTGINITPISFTDISGIGLAVAGGDVDNIPAALDPLLLNKAPTNIALSNNTVAENLAAFIGKFTTTDADSGDSHRYTVMLTPGAVQPDPAANFQAQTAPAFDELYILNNVRSGTYKIRVTTTDSYGATFTKDFDVVLTDVNKAPIAIDDGNPNTIPPGALITAAGPTNINVLANDTDPNDFPAEAGCPGCSVVSATNGAKGVVVNQGGNVRYIPTDPKFNATDSIGASFLDTFTYVMTDNDAPNALTASAKVSVTVGAEVYPAGHALAGQVVKLGDCNGSGTVEAGDLTATGLEIFDGDGSLWYDIYKGTRTAFSARGCNSNQDNGLDAGDISCTARKIFNAAATCGAVVASGANKATLEVASGLRGAAGSTVSVPVSLRNNGNAVDTAVFALAYDASKLSFNADDASAVSLSDGQLALVNAGDGRVEIVVTGLSAADGAVATIRLSVKESANGDASISLADSSLGSEGGSVAVDTADGAVQIGGAGSVSFRSLLPLVRK